MTNGFFQQCQEMDGLMPYYLLFISNLTKFLVNQYFFGPEGMKATEDPMWKQMGMTVFRGGLVVLFLLTMQKDILDSWAALHNGFSWQAYQCILVILGTSSNIATVGSMYFLGAALSHRDKFIACQNGIDAELLLETTATKMSAEDEGRNDLNKIWEVKGRLTGILYCLSVIYLLASIPFFLTHYIPGLILYVPVAAIVLFLASEFARLIGKCAIDRKKNKKDAVYLPLEGELEDINEIRAFVTRFWGGKIFDEDEDILKVYKDDVEYMRYVGTTEVSYVSMVLAQVAGSILCAILCLAVARFYDTVPTEGFGAYWGALRQTLMERHIGDFISYLTKSLNGTMVNIGLIYARLLNYFV